MIIVINSSTCLIENKLQQPINSSSSYNSIHQLFLVQDLSLSCDYFKSNSHNPKTWTVSFESHDVVIGKTDLPYLSEGLLTAIDVNDVRDYIIDFICTHEIGSNIQISFSLSSKIVHFEKLIAHNLS